MDSPLSGESGSPAHILRTALEAELSRSRGWRAEPSDPLAGVWRVYLARFEDRLDALREDALTVASEWRLSAITDEGIRNAAAARVVAWVLFDRCLSGAALLRGDPGEVWLVIDDVRRTLAQAAVRQRQRPDFTTFPQPIVVSLWRYVRRSLRNARRRDYLVERRERRRVAPLEREVLDSLPSPPSPPPERPPSWLSLRFALAWGYADLGTAPDHDVDNLVRERLLAGLLGEELPVTPAGPDQKVRLMRARRVLDGIGVRRAFSVGASETIERWVQTAGSRSWGDPAAGPQRVERPDDVALKEVAAEVLRWRAGPIDAAFANPPGDEAAAWQAGHRVIQDAVAVETAIKALPEHRAGRGAAAMRRMLDAVEEAGVRLDHPRPPGCDHEQFRKEMTAWARGERATGPQDAGRFGRKLRSCGECRAWYTSLRRQVRAELEEARPPLSLVPSPAPSPSVSRAPPTRTDAPRWIPHAWGTTGLFAGLLAAGLVFGLRPPEPTATPKGGPVPEALVAEACVPPGAPVAVFLAGVHGNVLVGRVGPDGSVSPEVDVEQRDTADGITVRFVVETSGGIGTALLVHGAADWSGALQAPVDDPAWTTWSVAKGARFVTYSWRVCTP